MILDSYSFLRKGSIVLFNSKSKIEKDGIANSGVLIKEDNPLIYRLDMFASLNFAGQALYENILITAKAFVGVRLTNEDLCGVFSCGW